MLLNFVSVNKYKTCKLLNIKDMMNNLQSSAFVAKTTQLLSSVARLRLLLVMLLTLTASTAWGATETITLSDFGWGNATVQSSIAATSASITLSKNSAGTAPTYYTSDGLRLYGVKSATTGGTISFTPKTGVTISKIVFTHTSSNSGVLAIKTGTGSYSSSSKTWSGTLTVGNTVSLVSTNSGSSNPQVRITQIVITYTTAAASKHTVTFDAGSGTCSTSSLTESTAGAGVTLPTATICDGWEFAGWKETSAISTETTTAPTLLSEGSNYKPTGNCTLYAVYSRTEEGSGPSSPQTETITINNFSSGTSTRTYSPDYATWTWKKNTGSDIATYEQIRLYQNHSMTISPKSGYSISNIVATCTSTSYASALAGGSLSGASKSVSGLTVTITPTGGDIVITQSAQSRVSQFQVTYTSSSGGSTTYYHSTPQCATQTVLSLRPQPAYRHSVKNLLFCKFHHINMSKITLLVCAFACKQLTNIVSKGQPNDPCTKGIT